jgi:hypothetical protein
MTIASINHNDWLMIIGFSFLEMLTIEIIICESSTTICIIQWVMDSPIENGSIIKVTEVSKTSLNHSLN